MIETPVRTMMAMHRDPAVEAEHVPKVRSSTKRRFAEYGRYFARQWAEHADAYRVHYATADAYRLDTVRTCWPYVGDHAKRYLRDAFNAELERLGIARREVKIMARQTDIGEGRTCDYVTAYGLPWTEKCGAPAVGKWHDEDDEWFCERHMSE